MNVFMNHLVKFVKPLDSLVLLEIEYYTWLFLGNFIHLFLKFEVWSFS
jgi:hypothetical protein